MDRDRWQHSCSLAHTRSLLTLSSILSLMVACLLIVRPPAALWDALSGDCQLNASDCCQSVASVPKPLSARLGLHRIDLVLQVLAWSHHGHIIPSFNLILPPTSRAQITLAQREGSPTPQERNQVTQPLEEIINGGMPGPTKNPHCCASSCLHGSQLPPQQAIGCQRNIGSL